MASGIDAARHKSMGATMSEHDTRVWREVLAQLRAGKPDLCRQWFDELTAVGLDAGILRVRTRSTVHRDYLQKHTLEAFNDAVRTVTGRLIAIRFLGPDDADPAAAGGHSGLARPPETRTAATPDAGQRRDALVINPDNTFENFVIGPGNRFANAASLAVADRPGQIYNPLFIHGDVGLGKSHLLQAICLRMIERAPHVDLYYLSCDGFMTQFFECLQGGRMHEFRAKFRSVDVLVIDDIHFLAKKEQSQEEFFHTFNALRESGKQIVLSSDASPQDIPHLEARLVSRFKQGMVAEITKPDFETRIAILRQKGGLRGMEIPEDVAVAIATRVDSNIRELEGVITSLQMRCNLDKSPPTPEMVMDILGPVALRRTPNEPTIHVVIKIVTEFYGVRLTDLQSKRRHRSVTTPRQVCMYLARRHTRHSLEEIGGHFGGRDHTTVMHAIDTIEDRRKENTEFDQQVGELDQRVRQSTGIN